MLKKYDTVIIGSGISGLTSAILCAKKGLKTTSIADDIEGTSKGIATASSRASEAKQDIDWDE